MPQSMNEDRRRVDIRGNPENQWNCRRDVRVVNRRCPRPRPAGFATRNAARAFRLRAVLVVWRVPYRIKSQWRKRWEEAHRRQLASAWHGAVVESFSLAA